MSISNETEYDYHDVNNLTAGVSMLLMAIFGIISNTAMIYVFCHHGTDKNSFNTICTTRAVANLYILIVVFGFIFLPTTLLGYTPLLSTPISAFLIVSGTAFYTSNANLTTLTALNRFCAIFFPLLYSRIWSLKQTLAVLLFIYGYRLVIIGKELYVSLTGRECWVYFSPKLLTWEVTKNEACDPYQDSVFWFLVMFLVTTGFNIITFVKVAFFYRRKPHHDENSKHKERKNTRLFFQTVLQDFLYTIDLLFTFQFS